MSDISVIIVSYHTGPALWLAIESTLAQPECRELILVDNGNIPGEAKRLQELASREPRFQLASGQGNVGFSAGCNLGAKKAAGSYLLFLNPDSMLPEGGLARALATLERYPENTLAGCNLANPDGTEQRGSRRALLDPRNAILESVGAHHFDKSARFNLHTTPAKDTPQEVPAISGAFLLLARAFYERLGGLDEGYFLHMEDMDLCYRVRKAGGRILWLSDVKVIHFRSTSEVPSAFVEKHKTRGFIRYFNTHFKDSHSPLFLKLLSLGIWVRYAVKTFIHAVDRCFIPPLGAKREIARLVLLYRLTRFLPPAHLLAGKTLLVTGSTGQTGLCVVGKALAAGAHVIAVRHKISVPFSHPNLTWITCDLNRDTTALHSLKVDAVIHTAPLGLLLPVLPKLFDAGVRRVIALSGAQVLFKTPPVNKHEQAAIEQLKLAEADIMHSAGDRQRDVTLLQPTLIYGVGLDNNISRLANVIRRFGIAPLYQKGSGQRHPVQAQDVADAILAILDNTATFDKSYALGGRQAMTYHDLLIFLFRFLGRAPRLISIPFLPTLLDMLDTLYQTGVINGEVARRTNQDLVFDITPAIGDFGYRPNGFLEGDIVL